MIERLICIFLILLFIILIYDACCKKSEVTFFKVVAWSILTIGVLVLFYKADWLSDYDFFNFPEGEFAAKFGQLGDFFGGVLNPIIGLGTVIFAVNAYHREKEKDRRTAQTTNFMKMYEAYVRVLNKKEIKDFFSIFYDGLFSRDTDDFLNVSDESAKSKCLDRNIKSIDLGIQEFFVEQDIRPHTPELPETILDELNNSIEQRMIVEAKFQVFYKSSKDVQNEKLQDYDYNDFAPLMRTAYHLIKNEFAQEGLLKWDNIRFFRAQLTEDELKLMAINCLFDKEGREGLAIVANKAGLFKHLKNQLFVSLLKKEADSGGFFDIKITEEKYKANPVIIAVGITTTMNRKDIIKLLEKDGWQLRGVRGSHHVYNHPVKSGHISVPHPKKDLGTGLVQKLLKQAGLK